MSKSKFAFFLSGSIAAVKVTEVISSLVKKGHAVQCIATENALRFVGPATLEGLTGQRVLTSLWEPGEAMEHIHVSRNCDMGVVAPASANLIAKMALGLGDDLVSTALLAWPKGKPLFIFPAMNVEMIQNPTIKAHLETLKARGFYVADTDSGPLACGEVGPGRLLEPEAIEQILTRTGVPPKGKLLITGGATREKIDGIRFISNVSTGKTASTLCDQLTRLGWSVTYLAGEGSQLPIQANRIVSYQDHADLNSKLREELASSDYVGAIHCAAVSDYTVKTVNGDIPNQNKKQETTSSVTLELRSTQKILPLLKEYSRNKNIKVVGFKLTLNSTPEDQLTAALKILTPSVDAIVLNDWSQLSNNRNAHSGQVIGKESKTPFHELSQLTQVLDLEFQRELL